MSAQIMPIDDEDDAVLSSLTDKDDKTIKDKIKPNILRFSLTEPNNLSLNKDPNIIIDSKTSKMTRKYTCNRICAAFECKDEIRDRIFRFPSDPKRLRLWLSAIKAHAKSGFTIEKGAKGLCSIHFSSDQFLKKSDGVFLCKNAIPRLFKKKKKEENIYSKVYSKRKSRAISPLPPATPIRNKKSNAKNNNLTNIETSDNLKQKLLEEQKNANRRFSNEHASKVSNTKIVNIPTTPPSPASTAPSPASTAPSPVATITSGPSTSPHEHNRAITNINSRLVKSSHKQYDDETKLKKNAKGNAIGTISLLSGDDDDNENTGAGSTATVGGCAHSTPSTHIIQQQIVEQSPSSTGQRMGRIGISPVLVIPFRPIVQSCMKAVQCVDTVREEAEDVLTLHTPHRAVLPFQPIAPKPNVSPSPAITCTPVSKRSLLARKKCALQAKSARNAAPPVRQPFRPIAPKCEESAATPTSQTPRPSASPSPAILRRAIAGKSVVGAVNKVSNPPSPLTKTSPTRGMTLKPSEVKSIVVQQTPANSPLLKKTIVINPTAMSKTIPFNPITAKSPQTNGSSVKKSPLAKLSVHKTTVQANCQVINNNIDEKSTNVTPPVKNVARTPNQSISVNQVTPAVPLPTCDNVLSEEELWINEQMRQLEQEVKSLNVKIAAVAKERQGVQRAYEQAKETPSGYCSSADDSEEQAEAVVVGGAGGVTGGLEEASKQASPHKRKRYIIDVGDLNDSQLFIALNMVQRVEGGVPSSGLNSRYPDVRDSPSLRLFAHDLHDISTSMYDRVRDTLCIPAGDAIGARVSKARCKPDGAEVVKRSNATPRFHGDDVPMSKQRVNELIVKLDVVKVVPFPPGCKQKRGKHCHWNDATKTKASVKTKNTLPKPLSRTNRSVSEATGQFKATNNISIDDEDTDSTSD